MKRRDFFQADDEGSAAPLRRADEGLVAAIVEEAKRRGIELTSDPVESEDQIPRDLYAAMAVVLSWMDGLANQPAESKQTP
jgi:type III secretion system FlhB-like substrate exporter